MSVGPQLEACIFCSSDDISQEHLVSEWMLRAFAKSKRPDLRTTHFLSQTLVTTINEDPMVKAGLTCHDCNGGWIKDIDDASAAVMKPLVRSEHAVELDDAGQLTVANWLFKSLLLWDALDKDANGLPSDMVTLREPFRRDIRAPPGIVFMVGPGPPLIGGRFQPFGVLRLEGNIQIKVVGGTGPPGPPSNVKIPGWRIAMGGIDAVAGGLRMPPVDVGALVASGFVQLWPLLGQPVRIIPRGV